MTLRGFINRPTRSAGVNRDDKEMRDHGKAQEARKGQSDFEDEFSGPRRRVTLGAVFNDEAPLRFAVRVLEARGAPEVFFLHCLSPTSLPCAQVLVAPRMVSGSANVGRERI
jgi:hypothetical protein